MEGAMDGMGDSFAVRVQELANQVHAIESELSHCGRLASSRLGGASIAVMGARSDLLSAVDAMNSISADWSDAGI
jgi:hypothetical protein